VTEAFRIERVDTGHVRVAGVLGFAQASSAFGRVGEVLGGNAGDIAVDVSGLQKIDSATLALLLAWAAQAAQRGRNLRLSAVPADLAALAHLCDAESLLGIA
jgi:phospholipid transport system transporter-binding protein